MDARAKRAVDYSFLSMILVTVSILIFPLIPAGNHFINLLLMSLSLILGVLFAFLGFRILTEKER